MTTILQLASDHGLKMRRKDVAFNPDKHSVVAGNLTLKKSGKIVGKILRVTSE